MRNGPRGDMSLATAFHVENVETVATARIDGLLAAVFKANGPPRETPRIPMRFGSTCGRLINVSKAACVSMARLVRLIGPWSSERP